MSTTEGWLEDPDGLYEDSRDTRPRPQKPTPRPATTGPLNRPLVFWVPVACPQCGERKPRTSGHYNATRYHQCQNCGLKFDSEELDPTPHIKRSEP